MYFPLKLVPVLGGKRADAACHRAGGVQRAGTWGYVGRNFVTTLVKTCLIFKIKLLEPLQAEFGWKAAGYKSVYNMAD